jgi:hypothetical protein
MKKLSLVTIGLAAVMVAGFRLSPAEGREDVFRSGSVKYIRSDGNGVPLIVRGSLTWSADGRYRHTVKKTFPNGNVIEQSFVLDPKWRYVETKAGTITEVLFDDTSSWAIDDDRRFFITAGPSRPLAAKLDDDDLKLFNIGADGLPKRVERHLQGRIVNVWEYSGSLDGGPITVPHTARYEVPGHPELRREFVIESARLAFRPPGDQLSTNWFARGKTIIDRRVSPSVTWTYGDLLEASKGAPMSPENLLALSRKRSREYGRYHDQKIAATQRKDQGQGRRSTIAAMSFALVISCSSLGIWLSRRRKER